MRDAWHARVRARFPHKKFTTNTYGNLADSRYKPREFLLNLEERVRIAPPFGRAFIHKVVNAGAVDNVLTIDQCRALGVKCEFLIRGDLINGVELLWMFDGMRAHKVEHNYHNVMYEAVHLPDFFCISYEFDLVYISRVLPFCSDLLLTFHVDPCVKFERDNSVADDYHFRDARVKYVVSYPLREYREPTIEEHVKHGHAFHVDTFRAKNPVRLTT
jgi:hypothetical protein